MDKIEGLFATRTRAARSQTRPRVTLARGERFASGASSEVLRVEGSASCTKVVRGGYTATTICEITLLTALSHPNIIKIVGIEYARDMLCIMMPCYSIGLKYYCNNDTPNTEEIITRLVCGVADGLAFMHKRGIIHCDLKPDNIYVSGGGECDIYPIIADLGTSMLDVSPRTDHDIQTPLYRAPEMHIGAKPKPSIDIWSLGVILLELTGYRHNFAADKKLDEYVADMRAALAKIPRDFSCDVSSRTANNPIAAALHGCFEARASERPTAAEIIAMFGQPVPDLRRVTRLIGGSRDATSETIENAIYAAISPSVAVAASPLSEGVRGIRMCITGQFGHMMPSDVKAAARLSRAANGKIFAA